MRTALTYLIEKLASRVRRMRDNEAGATAIEYGLLIALMAAGVAGGFGVLSDSAVNAFDWIATSMTNASSNMASSN